MAQERILIIDNDSQVRATLRSFLEPSSLEVTEAADTESALKFLDDERFHAILCNLVMEDGGGEKVLAFARNRKLQTPIIIVTGNGDSDTAESCLAAGAFDFITKPIDRLSLIAVVRRALLRSGLLFEEPTPPPVGQPIQSFPFLVGNARSMMEVLRQIAKIARVESNVCVYGESGTGKELVARAIHYSSPRSDRPLVVFDCTATPESLMESEMFGHVKGSFTSAVSDRDGIFQLADGGTLFIDEIGELNLPLQAKLLRVIQTREFRKVGGKHSIKVDVRIIAATNKDLRTMVSDGRFREDLFYRLEVIPLVVPPLRQRKDDIPLLVDHFIQRFNRTNRKQIHGVSSRTMATLLRYHWPGNVRELENCIERAAAMTDGTILDVEDLSLVLKTSEAPEPLRSAPSDGSSPRSLRESRLEAERDVIIKALESVQGNRTRAAELLGISLRSLHYKLKQHAGLPPAGGQESPNADIEGQAPERANAKGTRGPSRCPPPLQANPI